jgi:hypothetical protein
MRVTSVCNVENELKMSALADALSPTESRPVCSVTNWSLDVAMYFAGINTEAKTARIRTAGTEM